MSIVVGLAPEFTTKKLAIGDLIQIQIVLDDDLENAAQNDSWAFASDDGQAWIAGNEISADSASIKAVPAEGKITKLEFQAIIHSKGTITANGLKLLHKPSGKEFALSGEILHEASLYQEGAAQVPWTLPTLPMGGLNYPLIGLLLFLGVMAIFLGVRAWLNRRRALAPEKILNPREKAMTALDALQSYGKRDALRLEEWKKFSFELAGILRRYSDANFSIETLDLTDREFLALLEENPKAKVHVSGVAGILSMIDEVRYGTKQLESSLIPNLIMSAKKYVAASYVIAEPVLPEGKAR